MKGRARKIDCDNGGWNNRNAKLELNVHFHFVYTVHNVKLSN